MTPRGPIVDPASLRNAHADARAMIDALQKVDPQAVLVIRLIAGRMLAGYEQYGRLDLVNDKRDFERERAFELADLLTYGAMNELRRVLTLRDGRQSKSGR